MAKKRKQTTVEIPIATKPPLPEGWKWFRFDEIAVNINDRIDDPSKAGVEHYVGLDHLDSDSLKIRRWGTPDEVEAQKLRFRKGDIIFGKRRAYQRKVGVADFEGICSAHAMVLRANPKNIVAELLPFFLQTDAFMHRAVAISKGSLSPTINWPDLAKQQFALPVDQDEQQSIAQSLAIADEVEAAYQAAECAVTAARLALGCEVFGSQRSSGEWIPIGVAGQVQLGRQRSPSYETGNHTRPYLRVANVFDGYLDLSDVFSMDFDPDDFKRFSLRRGDILLNEGQSRELVGRSAIYRDEIEGCCFQNTLIRFRVSERLLSEFAHAYFQHAFYNGAFAAIASQTTSIAHLGAERFAKLRMPVPPLSEQERIANQWRCLIRSTYDIQAQLQRHSSLKKRFLGHLLTPKAES